MIKQKTIAVDVSYTGIGLHSGTEVNMKLRPAPVDTGIVFIRTDLPEKTQIKAIASNVTSTLRAGASLCRSFIDGSLLLLSRACTYILLTSTLSASFC